MCVEQCFYWIIVLKRVQNYIKMNNIAKYCAQKLQNVQKLC